jgi:hypothetical protein
VAFRLESLSQELQVIMRDRKGFARLGRRIIKNHYREALWPIMLNGMSLIERLIFLHAA